MRLPVVLSACLALVLAVDALAAITQPPQPAKGPGGSDYAHADWRISSGGTGVDAWYVFEPIDPQPKSAPLAVIMHGYYEFAGFVASKFLPQFGSRLIVTKSRAAREGGIVGLRRAPSSYTRLYYHSQIVRWWMEPTGALHLARYRLAPEDLGPESGLPGAEDVKHIWERGRLPDAEGGPSYLRAELLDRVHHGGVRMRFQVQLMHAHQDLDVACYDASVDWPDDDYPWHDIGTVALDETLSPEACERLAFNPWNHPPEFGVPPSTGIFDKRSLGDSEVRVMALLQRLRGWMYSAFGLPKVGP